MPWLSVLVPTYNGERYLRAALDSICAQGDSDVEVIAVDDGSSDSTVEILTSYDDRLAMTVVKGARIGSWVVGTNAALAHARGEWASVLHQDDAWLPGRLAAVRAATAPGVALVVHDARFVDDAGKSVGTWRVPLPPGTSRGALLARRLAVQNSLSVPAVTFRVDDARDVGGFDDALWYTADWQMWLALAKRGDVHRIATPLACYRVHSGALTATATGDPDEMRAQLRAPLESHLLTVADDAERARQERLGTWSAEVNVALAQAFHRGRPEWRRLGRAARALRPADWPEYVVASRLPERVSSRVRLALGSGRRRG